MLEQAINRLEYIIKAAPTLLKNIPEHDFSFKPSPTKWSQKEIIGHLIDSATNNHHRLVRGQFEHIPEIRYDQDKWCEVSFHQQMESAQVIDFWTCYNIHLLAIIKLIPKRSLLNQVKIGNDLYSLEALIIDYVDHLEGHLKKIIEF